MAHLNEIFIEKMKYMNTTMKKDNAAGHQWKYCNSSSKKAKGFEQARKQGKYLINCVDGVQWALKMAGVASNALSWYCSNGNIVWLNGNAKANAQKYFNIIKVGNKTVQQLYNEGKIYHGDILAYMTLAHTNAYYGGGKSFDSGHAYAKGSGEGAAMTKWIGNLSCKNYKVSYILRIKDRAHYRVQCGAYKIRKNAELIKAKLHKLGYGCELKTIDGMTRVQVGSDSKSNAERIAADLSSNGIACIIVEE